MAEHFKSIEDFLHFGGEALNIHFEIRFNVVRLVAQFFQRVGRGVIELIAGNAVHCLRRIVRILGEHIRNSLLGRLQGALQAAQNRHRDNDIAVLIRHIGAAQFVGDAPNKVYFRGDINWGFIPQCVKGNFVRHCYSPFAVFNFYDGRTELIIPCQGMEWKRSAPFRLCANWFGSTYY